ncbi:cupin domain-containing protein [Chloroflexota bacterium]
MKVINVGDVKWKEHVTALIPHQFGQPIVGEGDSESVRLSLIMFGPGARNKNHIHTMDQVLYVTDGLGIVSSGDEEHIVGVGSVIVIPAGERHWHGAAPGMSFTHLSITTPGETKFYD